MISSQTITRLGLGFDLGLETVRHDTSSSHLCVPCSGWMLNVSAVRMHTMEASDLALLSPLFNSIVNFTIVQMIWHCHNFLRLVPQLLALRMLLCSIYHHEVNSSYKSL